MALIIADRVKETTTTQGTGTIALSGATFGGFQSFSDAIGEGNTTYYCIQNESNFEIGIGTFSSGNLSRDTVIKSSNSDNKISIVGVAVVFGVVPSSKLIYKNADGDFVISGDVNVDDVNADLVTANSGDFGSILTNGATSSGLLTLKRTNAGNFIHAYVDDANDRTIGLYSDANTSPTWRLGLKASPLDPTAAPSYGYFYASEGAGGLIGDADNQITIANSAPFIVKHQGVDVITAHYTTGVHLQSNSSSYPAFVVNGGAALSADIQRWNNNAGTTLSVVDNAGNFGIRNSNPSYQLDVTGTGNFSQSIRFGDGTVQSTAYVNSSGELQSLITLNDSRASGLIASTSGSLQPQITTNTAASGSLQSQITSNAAVSGALQPQITTNAAVSGVLQSQISNIESTSVLSGVLQPQITINAAVSGSLQPQITTNDTRASGLIVSTSGSLQSQISAIESTAVLSGVLQPQITTNDTRASGLIASVSGALQHPITLNSNLSGVLQPQITTNDTRASGLIASVSGALQHPVTLNSNLSGVLQPQITTNDTRASGLIASVSGALQHPVTLNSNLSGVLQPQITTNDTRASGLIASVSGALQHPVTLNSNLSGVLQPQITTNDTRASGLIASVSGALQHPVTLNSNLSGVLQPQITTNDTRASGLIQSTIDSMSGIIVKEADGSPNVSNVNTIVVSNGTLTDNSNGQVTITTGGGGGGGGGSMSQFILEDGDGTEVTIDNNKEVKFVEGAGIDIDWTDVSDGSDGDPYDLTFTVDHDAANNFVANEHIDHTSVTLTAGDGLTGGGDISANRTFAVSVDDSTIEINSDSLRVKGDGIGSAQIADDAIDSEHYTDGSIDTAHIGDDQVTYAKIQNVSATDRILGRDSAGAGVIEEITPANLRTMINVEDGADVTDTTNVTSAGALMDSEVTNLAFVKALTKGISDGNVLTANDAVADDDFLRINGTEVEGLTVAEVLTALNVEAAADVTDTANVTAAGALMDSELTDLAGVKGVTISTLQVKPSEGAFANGDKTKLDGIEASADVTDATNVTAAGALMDSEVTNLAFVKGLTKGISDGNVLTANDAVADDDFLRINGTEVEGLTVTEVRTALNVEDGADVTDATNVTAAGALMDSELASIANVKALDQSVISGSSPNFTTANMSDASNKRFMTDAQESKLDAIEASADVSSFVLEDDSGDEVTITKDKEVKFIGAGGLTINWTDTDNGTDADPYDLTFTIGTLNQNTTGSAATLTTARAIALAGDVTGTANFDGSAGISITSTIADDAVTYAKMQNVSATNRILGRDSSGAGVVEEITPANLRTMINVEDGATADQTKSDINGLAITTVGTIDTGVWNGTAIASAYIADNAITGAKIALGSDAAGDIMYYNGTDYVRLGIGSDGQVLTVNDAANAPQWENASGGGGGGDITSVVAGAGLTGGATTGDATVNVIGGDGITANANDVAITAAQTTITSVYNASLKIGRDSQNLVDFATTDNKIILRANNIDQVSLIDNVFGPEADSDVDLGTSAKRWKDAYIDSITTTGKITAGGSINQAPNTATDGGIVDIDCSTANYHEILMNADATRINFTNVTAGQRVIVRFKQHSSHIDLNSSEGFNDVDVNSGNATIKWAGGIVPTLTESNNAVDVYGFIFESTVTNVMAFIIGQDIK